MKYDLHLGDCLEVLRTLPDASVDSIVTDPPYALPGGFMGKQWDKHDGREDAGFGYWLAGFTDGEGCFLVRRHERGTHTCAFQIKLRRDDRAVLERIRRFVGYGTVRDEDGEGSSSPKAVYVVQDKEGCEALVGLFRRYPLTAKKANDFEVWAEAVWEWLERPRGNRWYGQADQSRAALLKARLEDVRRYTDVPWSGHRFQDWCRVWAAECLRVLKPGGHMLAFGAPRQYHRLAAGIEDAGFEVRDCVGWVFASGYPKSHNLTGDWAGWGTALKPAWESIVVARKPLVGTVAENVLQYGTGALNIDGCRVGYASAEDAAAAAAAEIRGRLTSRNTEGWGMRPQQLDRESYLQGPAGQGRWPANIIHDGSDEVMAAFPDAPGQQRAVGPEHGDKPSVNCYGDMGARPYTPPRGDTGSAARFFYCAKASKRDRDEGLDHPPKKPGGMVSNTSGQHMTRRDEGYQVAPRANNHPTVKPTDLMRYLCRLVTPPGGTVLDPFMGSGSTGKAAMLEGFRFIGIEREAEYIEIARARIAAAATATATGSASAAVRDDRKLGQGDLFAELVA